MYFHDRLEAGDMLANQLITYRYENTAILALSPGGVLVGEQIARRLHAPLSMMIVASITGPGDESLVFGGIDEEGRFSPAESEASDFMSIGGIEAYQDDLRGYLEEEKVQKMSELARLWGEYGETRTDQLAGRTVILTSDGITNGISVIAAVRYLKMIKADRIVAAIPVGTFEAIEQASKVVNEFHYLYIPDTFLSVDHYYNENPTIDRAMVADHIDNIVARWT